MSRPWCRGCTYTTVLQKPFLEIQSKYHRGSWSDNHHFIILTRWQILRFCTVKGWAWEWAHTPLSPQREWPEAFLLCGFRCHKRLGRLESPVRPPDEDLAVSYRTSASKNCRKETKKKKSSSITMLINTKGYPILYTVVCDICGPYKMLSLSLDFVLILSWCIKY